MVRGIDPLSHQPKVSQTKQQSAAARPKKEGAQASDTVEISQGALSVAELTQLAESAPPQSKVNLDGVREKVQAGYYNTPEALENVASAVIESDVLQDADDMSGDGNVGEQTLGSVAYEFIRQSDDIEFHTHRLMLGVIGGPGGSRRKVPRPRRRGKGVRASP